MGKRIEREKMYSVDDDGWSGWIHPLPGYLMQCCDCGLVPEMQFEIGSRAVGPTGPLNPGENPETGIIIFRTRRHD